MNETNPLGVGIIGASAGRGWAKISHVPAVQHTAGLRLVAVASGSAEKARAAADEFGARAGYADGEQLVHDPAVDLVVVAVKVPDHRALVLAALGAGKHVFCEWPLGCDLTEAEEMAAAAATTRVHTAIGLQTQQSPAVQRARELIANGAIGRVLNARIHSTTAAFGPSVEAAMTFAEQPENGVTLVTIQGAHTLDLAIAVLGPLADLSALTTTQYLQVLVGEERESQTRTTPDHLLVQARLSNGGGALCVEVAGGRPAQATPFCFEVTGEAGVLALEGGAVRGVQSGLLRLSLRGESQAVNEKAPTLPDTAANVANLYAALRDDVARGARTVPDFDHALRLTRLVEAAQTSARTGIRQAVVGGPQC